MTFGIGPHRLGRILPGGVEMERRKVISICCI